jgi:tRNA (cmo5U34)-methyltransferase
MRTPTETAPLAFTHAELSSELAAAGIADVRCGFPRPLPYLHAYWKPAAGAGAPSPLGRHTPLPGAARRDAALLRWAFSA